MSELDPDKILALLDEQDAAFQAEMEKLGLGEAFKESMEGTFDAYKGSPDIIRVAHETPKERLIEVLGEMIEAGADVNAASTFGSTALDECFQKDAYEAMVFLIAKGADASSFGFSEAHLALLSGDIPDLSDTALMERDSAGRTPFLFACRIGHVAAAAALEPLTSEEGRFATPDGEGALAVAARSGSLAMLDWLLARGYPVDHADDTGATALFSAVLNDFLAGAERLLEAGASVAPKRNFDCLVQVSEVSNDPFAKAATAMMEQTKALMPYVFDDDDMTAFSLADVAYSPEMLRLLARHGVPFEAFDTDRQLKLVGADRITPAEVTEEMYRAQATPREGRSNPERVDIPFWREQIRTGRSAYAGQVDHLGKREYHAQQDAVWSFHRFGRTGTLLPDGRWVLIAGEHEDHYDPDFHIYSDVTVISPDGEMDQYIYPSDVFPPTDFHTATLMGDHILLIGNLSYQGMRRFGETQVLRLNLADFSIHPVETTGQNPGWISRHTAARSGDHILIRGGKVEPGYIDNPDQFVLDTASMVWSRVS